MNTDGINPGAWKRFAAWKQILSVAVAMIVACSLGRGLFDGGGVDDLIPGRPERSAKETLREDRSTGGLFDWKALKRQGEKRAREAEDLRLRAEIERIRVLEPIPRVVFEPETNAVEKVVEDKPMFKLPPEPQKKPESVEEVVEAEPKFEMPPEPPKKSEAEILREEEAHRKAVWAQIEERREKEDVAPLGNYADIKFGEPGQPFASAKPVKWGTAFDELEGDSVAARGVAFAVYGPKAMKPFGTKPLVWLTPDTRRPYRIEFSRPLAPKSVTTHDPDTTNIVAMLQKKLRCEPFVPRPCVPGRAGCEFVFPMGSTTWTVGEYDGVLRFSVEREDIRKEALAETEILRQRMSVVSADGERLDSNRYPNGGVDLKKYHGLRFKEGTPPAFCGVVFMSAPAENTTIQVPQKGAKGFFLDYRMAKCPPFRGFVNGRADIDPVRGGVYAIHLTSEGGVYGQDDKDYYETVRDSLSAHYKVKPIEKPGEGTFPNLIYQVGDVTIVFGPDPCGGFRLSAYNEVLTALARKL